MTQDIEMKPAPRQTIEVFDPIPLMDTGRFEQMQRLASIMARSPLIPECLRTTPAIDEQGFPVKQNGRNIIDRLPYEAVLANCFLIINQSVRWGMDPFAVAACVSVVRGRLCYEGKLVAGVLDAKLGIELDYQWNSEKGDAFGITVSGRTSKRGELKTVFGTVGDWKTTGDSSPWAKPGNHRRMLAYRGSREWARIHKPSLMLGVYTDDEMETLEARPRMTPVQNALGRVQPEPSEPGTASMVLPGFMRPDEPAASHGSPELDADAAKLAAMGQDPGPTLQDIGLTEEAGPVDENPTQPLPSTSPIQSIEPSGDKSLAANLQASPMSASPSNGESKKDNSADGPTAAASMVPPEPTDAAGYEAYWQTCLHNSENRDDALAEWKLQRKLRTNIQVDMTTVDRCRALITKAFPKEKTAND